MTNEAISGRNELDLVTRILHFGLAVFGILALATGDLAGDYKKVENVGFIVHGCIGLGVALFVGLRFGYGIFGPAPIRFWNWVPYNRKRLKLVSEDIKGLMAFRLPDRQPHQGLASLVETIGLLIFAFLAVTGVMLYVTIEPGHKAQGTAHFIKELHEAGEILLPLFFLTHIGAVILHALTGCHLWRKMIFLEKD